MTMTTEFEPDVDVEEKTDFIGFVVAWESPGQIVVKHSDVRAALDAAGFDPEVSKDMSAKNAFSRACKDLKADRVIKRLEDDDHKVSFQFTQEHLEAGRFEYNYEAVVEVDKHSGRVSCTNPSLATHAQELLNRAMIERTAADVTRLVQKLFKEKADGDLYPLTKKGAAYFCPQEHEPFVDQIDRFFSALGGQLVRFPVPRGTPSGDRSVRRAVSTGMVARIEALTKPIEDWDGDTRTSTKERLLVQFKKAKEKLQAWKEFLSAEAEAAEDAITAGLAEMRKKIEELDAQAGESDE